MGQQRRVREAPAQANDDDVEIDFDEAEIIETDHTNWILVGETWVDVQRIISVSPLKSIWDEEQGEEGIPEPEGGVAVQIDSPHDDTQFIQSDEDTVEDVMTRLVEATSE